MGSIVVLADPDSRLDEVRAQRARWDLQLQSVERHAIVITGLTFFLNAKYLAKIDRGDGDEGRAFLFSVHGKTPIVGGDVDIPNEGVGRLERDDRGHRQLFRQTVLQRLEQPFRAATRLRRIGRDVFDAEMIERPADLGQAGPIDLAAGLWRVKVVAAPIRIKAQRQAMTAEHFLQGNVLVQV